MGQPAVKTAPTVEKPPEIPAELAPRLWRPVIRLEERSGVRVLIGPGYASSREALDWTDRKIAYNGRYRRSTAAARRNAWRNARLQLVLTVKIPVLDHGVPERRRVQKLVRNAAADRARAGRPAGVVGDAAPGDRPTLTDAVKAVAPKRVKQLAAVAGPGQRNRMKITDAEAEESAAALLLGMGRRMRRTASATRWPRLWHGRERRKNLPGTTLPVTAEAVAAVLDWRRSQGRWPKPGDPVGEAFTVRETRRRLKKRSEQG